MPRGRKKKLKFGLNVSPGALKSVASVLLILLACLSLISFFAPDYALNAKLQTILRVGFGYPSPLLPAILALLGLFLMNSIQWKIKEPRVFIGLVLLLLMSSALMHSFYRSDALEAARDGVGGGMVGYKLLSILENTISIYGALLVLIAGLLLSFILLFNISLDSVLGFILAQVEKLKELTAALPFMAPKAEASVEFASGTGFMDNTPTNFPQDLAVAVPTKQKKAKPAFEVIPSLSEPQDGGSAFDPSDPSKISSIGIATNALPYADKVWELPPLDLLTEPIQVPVDRGDINARSKVIVDTLKSFGVTSKVVEIQSGPSVTQYALEAETGTKISKIANLQYDLALALASPEDWVRIEAPIPGRSQIGIEVPNNTKALVNIKTLLASDGMKAMKSKLAIVLGKDVGGQTLCYDIAKMPHMLIAGATGSGKSVFIHSILFSILFRASPQECKLILIDPKRVELINYSDIPHLFTPVVTDVSKAAGVFRWAVEEMEKRYKLFETARVRNIDAYNEKSGFNALPYIVIVCDELAEIMVVDPASVEKSIIRLAQLARATGIHLVLAVQRPSTNIITGLIKANIPTRISFNVASQIDSRVIIDQPGAEKLLGKGDMLFIPPDIPKPVRLQGAYVDDKEINNLVNFLKGRGFAPDYHMDIFNASTNSEKSAKSVSAGGDSVDEYFDEALEIVTQAGKASASLLQRRLSIGYARAARIIDELEQKGLISEGKGSKPREIKNSFAPTESADNFDDVPTFDLPEKTPGSPF